MNPSPGKAVLKLLLLSYILLTTGAGCTVQSAEAERDKHRLEEGLLRSGYQQRQTNGPQTHPRAKGTNKPRGLSPTQPVRAIYVSSHVANGSRLQELIRLIDATELNAMVIDINSGIALTSPRRVNGRMDEALPVLSQKKAARHFQERIQELKRKRIYLIARIVTFKNPELANAVPTWAMKRRDGAIWRDRSGTPWIDPYKQKSWEYPIALAEHAAQLGFDEVQFDYVRFPENASKVDREIKYANTENWTKAEAIRSFLHLANARLHDLGIRVSADVFGLVGSSEDDMGIGQKWDMLTKEVDVISPMIYPSHYSDGMWGIAHPDLTPGPIIARALKDAANRNRRLLDKHAATAQVRPWLQAFTASWLHPHQRYEAGQVREQILAARNAGYSSYMLWNSSCRYPMFSVGTKPGQT